MSAKRKPSNPRARKAPEHKVPSLGLTREKFDRLCKRANDGDSEAQQELKALLDAHPEIWRGMGDLAAHAQKNFIRLIAEDEFLLTEAINRKAAEMRRELAGAFPTPLELMAVERVVGCWLQLQYVSSKCAQAEGELSRATFWLKRADQAQRAYDAAVRSLLLIRELLPSENTVDAPPGNGHAVARGVPGTNGPGVNRVAVAARASKRSQLVPA